MKTIGVLGGVGPAATAHFFTVVVEQAQEQGAVYDHEYPTTLTHSISFDGFDEHGITDEKKVTEQAVAGVRGLEQSGADVIAMPCNTLHVLLPLLRDAVSVPIIDMIAVVGEAVEEDEALVLASRTTHEEGLYHDRGFDVTPPDDFDAVDTAIRQAMAGENATQLNRAMQESDAPAVILGCTELPLLSYETEKTVYDSSELLASHVVDVAYDATRF